MFAVDLVNPPLIKVAVNRLVFPQITMGIKVIHIKRRSLLRFRPKVVSNKIPLLDSLFTPPFDVDASLPQFLKASISATVMGYDTPIVKVVDNESSISPENKNVVHKTSCKSRTHYIISIPTVKYQLIPTPPTSKRV
jgi:hypothetical protein